MSRRTQKNVGVIGLGIIGRRVADCLRHHRFATFVWNRTPRAYPNFVGSPAEIAELCDFIQIFVSDDDALMQVVQQMKQSLGAHHIVMAHSTVSPGTMRAVAEVVQRRGAQLLDAPFTGSKPAAERGELVYYIGGDDAAYRRARPILEASSKEIIEIGEIGQATTIKVATNMITAATVQSAAEALALLQEAGLPLTKFVEAMEGNGSNSGTLKMKLPKMLSGDFDPQFSVKHMLKDVEIAARLGRSHGLRLAIAEVARDALADQVQQGHADEDYAAVVRGFFPDGPLAKESEFEGPEQEEEQDDLTAWAERTPSESRLPDEGRPASVDEKPAEQVEPEAVARNGHTEHPPEVEDKEPEVERIEEPEEESERLVEGPTEPVALAEPELFKPMVAQLATSETAVDEPATGEDVEGDVETTFDKDREEVAPAEEVEEEEEPVTIGATADEPPKVEPEEPRRGFFSRLFGKSADY